MGFAMPANMEDMEAMVYGDDDDDLEAELAALTGGEESTKKSSPNKKGKLIIEINTIVIIQQKHTDEKLFRK